MADSSTSTEAPVAKELPADKAAAILKQVEFYFSDANFGRDKFLIAETAKSPEQWIALSVIAGFNRMKVLVPTADVGVIAGVLASSDQLEVSEDKISVRRVESRWNKTLGGKKFTSRDEIITFARSLIQQKPASADDDAPADAPTASSGADGELDAAAQSFVLDLLEHHERPAEKKGCGVERVKVGRNPNFPDTKCFVIVRTDGTEVDFSYIKCVDKLFPRGDASIGRYSGSKRKAREGDEASPAPKKGATDEAAAGVQFESGQIVSVQELKEGATVDSIKAAFGGKEKVKYVEIVPDMPLAYVRFASAAVATEALGNKEACDGIGSFALLEGDDERQYWEKIGTPSGRGSGGGRGGGRGGRGKGKGKGKGGKGRGRGRGRM